MNNETIKELKGLVRDIPNYPKEGIIFKDITTLLNNPDGFKTTIELLYQRYKDQKIDAICGIDARGFIFGGALANQLGCSFVPIRKKSKLPADTYSVEYALEYGTDSLEIHQDAFKNQSSKVVIIDDLLATGGTAAAAVELATKAGAKVHEACFVISLDFLEGSKRLNVPTFALLSYS